MTDLLLHEHPCCSGPIKRPHHTIISAFSFAGESASIYRSLDSLIPFCKCIHLFALTVYPLPLHSLFPSFVLQSSLLSLITDSAHSFLLTSIHLRLSIPLISPFLPSTEIIHPSIHPFPPRPLGRKFHNEITASLIVLIKAVRKELREEKYSQQQGKQGLNGVLLVPLFQLLFIPPYFLSVSIYTHTHLFPPFVLRPFSLDSLK